MVYRPIDNVDNLQIRRVQGGDKPEHRTMAEIREYATENVAADITALQAIVQTAIEGAPVAPVAATVSLAIDEGISLDFTAKTAGVIGEDISVELTDPGEDGELEVEALGNAITVYLAYDDGAITSTLAEIKAAIEATPAAHALVSVAVTGSDATVAIAVDATNLDNGVNGTVGVKGALRFGATALYVSTDASTTAVSNWETISFD